MSLSFQKKAEDFVCEHCGAKVVGNGYTNHCPQCLWSKHVDNNPGDRASTCQGMMKPTNVIHETGEYHLINTCIKCGYQKKNRMAKEDNFDVAAEIAKKKAEQLAGRK